VEAKGFAAAVTTLELQITEEKLKASERLLMADSAAACCSKIPSYVVCSLSSYAACEDTK